MQLCLRSLGSDLLLLVVQITYLLYGVHAAERHADRVALHQM